MAIQIIRNADGNCIEFRGSTNPVYWNACLSGEVDVNYPNTVNVLNDVATAAGGETVYEFFQIDYNEFRDQDNVRFDTAQDVADYITAQGNVTAQAEATYQGVWDAETNTPALSDADTPEAGDFYYVAVPGTTTLGGVSVWKQNDRVIWSGTEWQKVDARQLIDASTRSVLLNTQTAIFADGEHGGADPTNQVPGWYYKNSENGKINWYLYGDTPSLDYTLGDFGGFYAVVDLRSPTSYLFWQVYTTYQGDGQDQSWYRSRVTYNDENAVQAAAGKVLIHSAGLDVSGIEPLLPRVSVGIDALSTTGLQEADEEIYLMSLSTSSNYPEGYNEFVVEKVGYKFNDIVQEFQLSSPPTTGPSVNDTAPDSLDFRIDPTNTTILLDDGTQFGVNSIQAQGNGDGTVDIVALPSGQVLYDDLAFGNLTIQDGAALNTEAGTVNALNSLFQVQPLGTGGDYAPTYPLLALDPVTENRTNGQVPTTTLSDGVTPHLMVSASSSTADAYYSDETIDTAGEFYTVRIAGKGRFILGLGSEADGDRAEIAAGPTAHAAGLLWGNAFYNYGAYRAPWTTYGSSAGLSYGPGWTGATTSMMRYNTSVQDELDAANLKDGALFKVGIDNQGYIAVWYYDEGRSNDWIMTARRSLTTAAGDYFLVVKLWDGTATLASTPERSAVDPTAPALDYRYIESPDGVFTYPLFATEEEANYVDTENLGSGTSHTHIFPDDPTYTTWYMPDTGGTMGGSAAPADTAEIIYDEIPTLADSQFAPAAFDISDLSVDEGAAVNYQVAPTGTTGYTTTVSGLPAGLSFDGYTTVQGTAPAVTGDNVANPSDDYTVTVTRANDYGSTVDTFVLTVANLTAPQVEISGFSHVSGSTDLVDSDTMDDGSVVYMDVHLDNEERMIIPQAWVESYILPAVASGATVRIGVPTSSADWSTISDADFSAYMKWSPNTASAHYSKIASPTADDLTSVGSATDSVYDYAFEHDGTDLHVIACNVNSINTEPAINEGGSFARDVTWANSVHNQGQSFRIYVAVDGAQMDIAETGINVLDIPEPPAPTMLTSWDKALDFSGSSERAQMVETSAFYNPMMMANKSVTVSSSTDANARPWAATCVFKIDGHQSNQHIWNCGEGAGSSDDNIYLRTDSWGALYFGWGRQGALNEYLIATNLGTAAWYGVYIGHRGVRYSGSDATASNLASQFQIKLMFSYNGVWDFNPNPNGNGAGVWTTTGGRMDRSVEGAFTVGGRGSNRNFHGKVASMVVTTLKREAQPLPSNEEIKVMVTDPIRWIQDYKVGETFRQSYNSTNSNWDTANGTQKTAGTQIWLMGDGTSDSYAKIRNQVHSTDQNYTPLNMINMVSNDIQTVSIPGLS